MQFLDWLFERDRRTGKSRDEIRARVILNLVCLLALASIVVVTAMILAVSQDYTVVSFDLAQNIVSFVLYALCWVLVRRGTIVPAAVGISLFANTQITLLAFYYGTGAGIQWYYAVIMAASMIVLPGNRGVMRLVLAALPVLLFFWVHYEFRVLERRPMAEGQRLVQVFFFANTLSALLILGSVVAYFRGAVVRAENELIGEQARSEELLLNILPAKAAARLKAGEGRIADRFESVSVLFADLVHFTGLARDRRAEDVVMILDEIFTAFDHAAAEAGLEKVKTIGDAYMAVAGAPEPCTDHAIRAVRLAERMIQILADISARKGIRLELRAGIHSGPVVAGVIGKRKFAYDFWGDTVNIASRMESHGVPGRVHITEDVMRLLSGEIRLEEREVIEVKGVGLMRTFLVSRPGQAA